MVNAPDHQLELGFIAGTHGVAGAVRVQMHDPSSDALRVGLRITLVRQRVGTAVENLGQREVRQCAPVPGKAGRYRVTLAGIDDRDAAESLKGCSVWADRSALPPLGEDEFYLADTIGLAVRRERPDGPQELGTVVGLMSNGAQDLLEVELTGRGKPIQWLLPVLPGFVLDIDDERVLVDVPLGLLPDELER